MTKIKLGILEENEKQPYRKLEDDELLAIVRHEDDHYCQCLDKDAPDCFDCYLADQVLIERFIFTGHYYD